MPQKFGTNQKIILDWLEQQPNQDEWFTIAQIASGTGMRVKTLIDVMGSLVARQAVEVENTDHGRAYQRKQQRLI